MPFTTRQWLLTVTASTTLVCFGWLGQRSTFLRRLLQHWPAKGHRAITSSSTSQSVSCQKSTSSGRVDPKESETSGRQATVATLSVTSDEPLGDLLLRALPRDFPSRTFMRKMLARGQVLVDGTPTENEAALVKRGAHVAYVLAAKPRHHHTRLSGAGPPSLQLEWAHVDEHVAVCIKPQGIATQGDESATRLRQAVGWALPPPNERPDAYAVPRHVHRIDKMTGGLLVFARTGGANVALAQAFAAHDAAAGGDAPKAIQKTYLAIVVGRLDGAGVVDAPISGKRAVSRWRALSHVRSAASCWLTTLELAQVPRWAGSLRASRRDERARCERGARVPPQPQTFPPLRAFFPPLRLPLLLPRACWNSGGTCVRFTRNGGARKIT